jgi:hypothetical protein
MTLQEFCNQVEKTWPVLIQIKQEKRRVYAGYGVYIHLVVTLKNTSYQVISQETIHEVSLKWWLRGILDGLHLRYQLDKGVSKWDKPALPADTLVGIS